MKNDFGPQQSLVEHLIELRTRLIWAFLTLFACVGVCYYFAADIYAFLVAPLAAVTEGESRRLIYTGMAEAFFTYMKVAFFAGGFLAFPILAWQVWLFIAPGLYEKEKSAFLPYLVATPILFLFGACLAYYGVIPLAWKFFLSFENPGNQDGGIPIVLEARVEEYLSMTMTLIFAFGAAFQLPIVLMLLARSGMITSDVLAKRRRYALIIAFIVGAILTPPDVISQTALSIPLYLLYETSILLVKWGEKRRGKGKLALEDIKIEDIKDGIETVIKKRKKFLKTLKSLFAKAKMRYKKIKPLVKKLVIFLQSAFLVLKKTGLVIRKYYGRFYMLYRARKTENTNKSEKVNKKEKDNA